MSVLALPRVRDFANSFSLRASRLAAALALALIFLCLSYSAAAAQIALDGLLTEPDWHLLGTSAGGPPPSFGAGHEINALYARIDSTHLYIGVAGNVQFGNRILVFIDSIPGGYTNGNFGRASAPPGISNFNQNTVFDEGFTPNYVLSISTNNGQINYFWDLYTLSGSFGAGGGPNLFLGDRNDVDLRANPANADQTRGFEARLTYSTSGAGVDIAINQSEIRMMAMYINDSGVLSNQFISRANPGETGNYGSGPILFNTAAPNPVSFGHMLVVNEIDYIQPGANVSEFIELKNITAIPVSLDNYRLRFARGVNSPPDVYREIDLPNVIVNPGAYFVICTNPANVPNCNFTVEPPMDLLENAIPAAVALVQNNIIVDVVSYGGNTGAPYSEGAGVVPTDDGTQEALGISRVVDGMDTNRNNIDFGLRCVTPGAMNSAQTGGCGPATPTFTPTPTPTSTSQTPTPTGTSTSTATPTPTGSATPTPTGTITPPPPAGCSNILVNGDFEAAHGWEFGKSPVPGKYTSIPVHGGIRAVQLGITPESGIAPVNSYSSIRQAVSVPRGATIQLRWWHFHRTELTTNDSPGRNEDRQEVILLRPNGDTLRIVQRVRRNDNAWQQSVIDLTEYAGHSFVLYFNVYNTGVGRTWTFLDDVELIVCPPQGGHHVPYGHKGAFATPIPYSTPVPGVTFTPTATPTATPTSTSTQQAASSQLAPESAGTPTPTVTPTNTASPSPSPSSTLVPSSSGGSSTLHIMSWNVESGQADPVTIAEQIAAFDGVDLWGLSEVNSDNDAMLYESAAEDGEGAQFSRVTGSTGGGDRLVAIYDDDRFDLIAFDELEEININGNVRAPLVLTLTESATGLQFLFMVNHLYRSEQTGRHMQASLLNQWGANQTLPVIAVGDYNFDWDINTGAHDAGYDLMVAGDVWRWIKPATLVTTQCSGYPCTYNSVLDFVFVAGAAKAWSATSEIVVRPGDFPDDDTTSDHRPVRAIVSIPESSTNIMAFNQSGDFQTNPAYVVATPQDTIESFNTFVALPTPTLAPVDDRPKMPDNCIELVVNGSFEARGMGWSQEGSQILPAYASPVDESGAALQGGLAIRLGVMDNMAVSGISATQQLVQLPKDRSQVTLRFRYFPLYNEPPSRGDFQYVDIYHGTTGQFIGRALGVQRNDRVWIDREYDLSTVAGEPVRLFFMVSNDGVGGSIAMYVDDVSIVACEVAKPQPPTNLATMAQAQPSTAATSTSQPLVAAIAFESNPQNEIVPRPGFSFGRISGLLAVLGIAGAALVLLPLTKRLSK